MRAEVLLLTQELGCLNNTLWHRRIVERRFCSYYVAVWKSVCWLEDMKKRFNINLDDSTFPKERAQVGGFQSNWLAHVSNRWGKDAIVVMLLLLLTLLFSSRSLSPYSKKDKPPQQHLQQSLPLSTCPMHNSSSRVRAMQSLPLRGKVLPNCPKLGMLERQTSTRKSQLQCHSSLKDTREFRTLPNWLKMGLTGCRHVRHLRRIPTNTTKEHVQDQI